MWPVAGHIPTREPGVVAAAPESFQVRETNLKPELVREAATKSSASSQDRKRAASADSAGTSSSSIRREVGSSGSDRQPRHVKIVDAGGVAAGDLGLLVVRHPGQDLKPRVTSHWEGETAGLQLKTASVRGDMAAMSQRIDRIEMRLDRIERRLEIVPAPAG